MTDRHGGYIVTLEEGIREDDAEGTLSAIRQIRRVIKVEPIVETIETHIAQARARQECGGMLLELYRKIMKGGDK